MAVAARETIAFSKPGGERCVPSKGRPVDLVHLTRQTLGDRAVEQEVLGMFMHQLVTIREGLGRKDADERRALAHTLKGAASGVGAFAIADCAENIEQSPSDDRLVAQLSELIDQAQDFIAAINR